VCTARSPRCEDCPLREACAWRAAGYPAYDGPVKTKQKQFAGSDRQVRGIIMAELRSTHRSLTEEELRGRWPDGPQFDRALAGLVADRLAVRIDGGYALPHE
jgi:A/G-specific adenine glycosylase